MSHALRKECLTHLKKKYRPARSAHPETFCSEFSQFSADQRNILPDSASRFI